MKQTVLKALSIALTLMLMLALVACTTGTPAPSSSGTSSSASSGAATDPSGSGAADTTPATPAGSRDLFAIEESEVHAQESRNMSYYDVEGQERTEMLAGFNKILNDNSLDLLMGIGELTAVQVQLAGNGGYTLNILANGTAEDYKKLTDYYKGLGGEATFESSESLVMSFDWGRLASCRFNERVQAISVSFSLNAPA